MPIQSEYTLTIRQWDRNKKSDPEWHHNEFSRIAGMIAEGYTAGEINGSNDERGWWELKSDESHYRRPRRKVAKA